VEQAGATGLVKQALDGGINFFDTADVYSQGQSEAVLGAALKELGVDRESVVIATKVRGAMSRAAGEGTGDVNNVGLSRKHIIAGCEASLRRLGTDYIDLYQIHCEDLWTPLEETLDALDQLVRAGKVLYVGASNYRAYRLMKALGLSDRHGWARFVSLQPQYNLLVRTIEREHFALAREEGLALLTWSPLAAGMLTGKISRDAKPPESRLATRDMEFYKLYFTERSYQIVDVLRDCARETGCAPAALAIAWQLTKPEVTSVILGARTVQQLDDTLAAAGASVSPEVLARLDEASAIAPEYPNAFIDMIQRWLGNR